MRQQRQLLLSSNGLSFSSFAFLRFPEVLFVNKLYPMK